MAANRVEGAKPEGEKSERPAEAAPAPAAGAAASGGGMQPWLPLVAAVVLMPVLAWAVTNWILLPKLQKGLGVTPAAAGAEPAAEASSAHGGGHGSKPEAKGEAATEGPHKEQVPLTKLLVNVNATMGSRYLLTSLMLVGTGPELKARVEKRDAQLRDTAGNILSAKTLQDLEKPGARNIVRSELINAFNTVLGAGSISEIYITEFAIQ